LRRLIPHEVLDVVTLKFAKSVIASLIIGGGWVSRGVASDATGLEFFEKKVRPVLAERCYECHSHQAKKLKANLYLDSRDGMLLGGDTGVTIGSPIYCAGRGGTEI